MANLAVVGRNATTRQLSEPGDRFQLSDRAYAALLRAIARCELRPGTWLNERDASAELGMSRTPFREALHRLTLDGLIQIVARRGARVTLLDLVDIQNNLEVRGALETSLVRRVIADRLPLDAEHLEHLIDSMREAVSDDAPPQFLEADEEFHRTIATAAHNDRAIRALSACWVHINRARYLQPPSPDEMRSSVAQHMLILRALQRHDLDEVEQAMTGHVQSARELFGELATRMPEAFTQSAEAASEAAGARSVV